MTFKKDEQTEQILQELIDAGKDAELKLIALDRIRVPDSIEFRGAGMGYGLGLEFNDGTQELTYYRDTGRWAVGARLSTPRVSPLYLEPCKRSDLKAGDWWVNNGSPSLYDFNLYVGNSISAHVTNANGVHPAHFNMYGKCLKVVQ